MTQGIELGRMLAGKPHAPVVYFVRHGSDAVKVGTTKRLRDRISSMYLRMSDVILVVPGGREVEIAWHEKFREYQIREPGRRELFALAPVLTALGLTPDEPVPVVDIRLSAMTRGRITPHPSPDGPFTLREAADAGLWPSLAAARKASTRPGFPEPVGVRDLANLYDLGELKVRTGR